MEIEQPGEEANTKRALHSSLRMSTGYVTSFDTEQVKPLLLLLLLRMPTKIKSTPNRLYRIVARGRVHRVRQGGL